LHLPWENKMSFMKRYFPWWLTLLMLSVIPIVSCAVLGHFLRPPAAQVTVNAAPIQSREELALRSAQLLYDAADYGLRQNLGLQASAPSAGEHARLTQIVDMLAARYVAAQRDVAKCQSAVIQTKETNK